MTKKTDFSLLAERFHDELVELVKRYQFRDRNEMACAGLSVSQCYMVETLHRNGKISMKTLAEKMHLSVSTVTRVIQPLVDQNFVSREAGEDDSRVRFVRLTRSGHELFQKNWSKIIESEKEILLSFPEENREMLIRFLHSLNQCLGGCTSQRCKC